MESAPGPKAGRRAFSIAYSRRGGQATDASFGHAAQSPTCRAVPVRPSASEGKESGNPDGRPGPGAGTSGTQRDLAAQGIPSLALRAKDHPDSLAGASG